MTDLREQLQQDLGDKYTLENELTGGGMSRVFVATDNSLGRKVVLKILPPARAAAVSSQRFRREIQLAANLQHAHIVPLHSAGEINGLPYFTMPYVRGESLKTYLVKVGELPLAEAIRILREVASALAYAHENNIVHRDIKPDNVLISGDSAVVTDFGVAKALSASRDAEGSSLTSMGIALGTPAYMAPEQATADPHTDHRADLYALGVMAYEMITGTTPFANRTPQATLAAPVTEAPDNVMRKRSNTPPGLAAIVMKCLEKRPADRPQSAREVMNQLDALSTPTGGTTPTASYRAVKSRKWLMPAIAGVAVLLIAGAFAYTRSGAGRNASAVAVSDEKSIAVLPFKNMSGDAANEYFSDGMSEELLNVLAQIPGLRVAARGSSFQFKGKTEDMREVGKKLGVATLLDGSVRRSGDRMRITAQLIDAKSGYQMWTETYDRTASDVFAVQDEITNAIGHALQVRFSASDAAGLKGSRPASARAFELYLKGVFAANRGSETGNREAVSYYKQATEEDPEYVAAWSLLGTAYLGLSSLGYMQASKAIPEAERAIDRALSLSPEFPRALLAKSMLLMAKGDYAGAEAVVHSVIDKNPNLATAHARYARILAAKGEPEEAVREARAAQQLDPLSMSSNQNLGLYLLLAGRFKEAVETMQKTALLSPNHALNIATLAQTLAENGQNAEAVEKADRAVSLAPDDPLIEMNRAYVYAKAGRRDDALKTVHLQESKPDASNYAFEMAAVYSALGEKGKAFEHLDKLTNIQGLFLAQDPMLSGLHNDPRFEAVLRKWKLK